MRTLPVLLMTLALAACASAPNEPPKSPQPAARPASVDGFANTSWKLVEASGGALQATAIESGITLVFANGQVSGHGGCNRYVGSYSTEGSRLIIGQVASTKMLCMGANGENENAFLAWLQQPLDRAIDTADLRLRGSKDGLTLVFVADAIPADGAL